MDLAPDRTEQIFKEAVYVLHAFEKKTHRTARSDIELARRRLKELLRQRRGRIGSRREEYEVV